MKIWKDINEPSSTDYTWIRLNEYGQITGTLKYKDGKWVLVKSASGKNSDVDLSEIVNGAPEELDTLGEIATAINGLANVAFSGDYDDLSNTPNQRTFKEFKSSWPTSSTLAAFCQAVMSDPDANVGNAYLGGLSCSGLPTGMGQGDVVVEIIGTDYNKVVKLTLTSTDVSPYHWEGCYWQGSFRGWKTFELDSNKTTTLSVNSTNAQYPSAKAVYDVIVANEEVTAAALCDLDSRAIGLDNRVTALEQPSNILTVTDHETIYSTTPKTKAQMAEFLNITESQLDDVFAFKYPVLERTDGNDSYYLYIEASSSVIGPTRKCVVWGNEVYSLRYEDGVGYFEEYTETVE